MSKKHFDINNFDFIVYEYLGLNKEYLDYCDIDELKATITQIIEKYGKNTKNIDYILKDDIEYAYKNKNDINIIEEINGIIIYENLVTEYWLVFKINGMEKVAYTINDTFQGEKQATFELLASENNCNITDIEINIEKR